MPLSSMTGFARQDGHFEAYSWNWEVKSVNGKGLDVRCRLPYGFEALEPEIRKRVTATFARGNFQIGCHLKRQSGQGQLSVNEEALAQVMSAVAEIEAKAKTAPSTADGILALRGVLELIEPEETDDERAARDAAVLASFDHALSHLQQARLDEGAKMASVLDGAVSKIDELAKAAHDVDAAQPDALRARLKSQVEELLSASPALPEDRLAQEVALLVTKADIREEIDRLQAHVVAARDLLAKDEPVGRKLDFLMQEFNREANTLCSKASDVELTRIGLDLKAVIDQAREQVQNIE